MEHNAEKHIELEEVVPVLEWMKNNLEYQKKPQETALEAICSGRGNFKDFTAIFELMISE